MTQSVTLLLDSPSKKTPVNGVSLALPHNYTGANERVRNNALFTNGHNGYSSDKQELLPRSNGTSTSENGSTAIGQSLPTPSISTLLFVGLLLIWYALSVGHNILNKRLLEADLFPFPFTLTLLQLCAITVYSYLYIRYSNRGQRGQGLLDDGILTNSRHVIVPISDVLSKRRNRILIILLSLGKFMSLVFSHLSLYQVPLAFTHTVKGGLPLFVVFFSRIFLKTKHSTAVYLSLFPIVVGISMASLNSSSDWNFTWGIVFAVLSTMNLALLNVFSKKLLTTTYSAISLLHLLTKCSLMIFLPFYLLTNVFNHRETGYARPSVSFNLILLLLMDGIMSFSQNLIAFSLLNMCTPLTYSIANCSKRVAIISISFVFFTTQNVSTVSLLGIFISLFGIFCYNMAKHAEKYGFVKAAPKSGPQKHPYYSLNV